MRVAVCSLPDASFLLAFLTRSLLPYVHSNSSIRRCSTSAYFGSIAVSGCGCRTPENAPR